MCSSHDAALEALDKHRDFLKAGGVFTDDVIDAYIELKTQEVTRYRASTHSPEFDVLHHLITPAADGKRRALLHVDTYSSFPDNLRTMKNLQALSEEELTRLDQLLLFGDIPEDGMTLSSLDGYLTALAVGPESVPPSQWLPHVFSETEPRIPEFESAKEYEELLTLIMRRLNEIISGLTSDPCELSPLFNIHTYGEDQRECTDAEAWSYGFWLGMQLSWKSWEPLLESAQGQQLTRAIRLLGAPEVTNEEEARISTPSQREALSTQIPDAVVDIYFYWLPYRHAVIERTVAETYVRAHPKLGRNDPCPCGSGRKFKKCCGAAGIVH